MKAVTFLTLMLFNIVFVLGSALAGELVWDFETAGQEDDWQGINGTWELKDGVYHETSAAESGMHAYVGDASWENYTVESKIRVDEGKYSGLVFRGMGDYEYYVFYTVSDPFRKNEKSRCYDFAVVILGIWG